MTTAVETGTPVAERIVNYAARHGVGLIVVGTHGRTGVSRALLGSVAERVVRTARCPVLAVPCTWTGVPAAAEAEVDVAATQPPLSRCIVCRRRSSDLVCAACRADIRGEAFDHTLKDERAGRR
jgi:hypothetical protein